MPWPRATDYNEAIQNLRWNVSDDELREGQPALSRLGLPSPYSGGFADVYKVHCPQTGNTWAVKCFTKQVPGLRERYRQISLHLKRVQLPFMMDFDYVEPGIRVGGESYPFLKMRWVEGLNLNKFVHEYLNRPRTLKLLLPLWIRLASRLREAEVAHADLQHGNVLLVPGDKGGPLSLKLIDYDGMWVPSLSGERSAELGHPAYQHPERLREGTYSKEVDRFSHLAIYTAIQCLVLRGKELRGRFGGDDNLLFREVDFANPASSEVFRRLWSLRDGDARSLVGRLILAATGPLDRVPQLDEVVREGRVEPLTAWEEREASAALDGGGARIEAVPPPAAGGEMFWGPGPSLEVPAAPSPVVPLAATVDPTATPASPGPEHTLPIPVPALVPTTAAEVPLPPTPAEPAAGVPRTGSIFFRILDWGVRIVRGVDRFLLRLAGGEEYTIVHNFLRMALAACMVAGTAVSIAATVSYLNARQQAILAEQEAAKAREEAATRQQALRERVQGAQGKAEAARKAAEALFQTKARPACYDQGEQVLSQASSALHQEKLEEAERLFLQAGDLLVRAQAEAPTANKLGKAQEAWSAALAAADKGLLKEYAGKVLTAAEAKAASAAKQAKEGNAAAAAAYDEALATLNQAVMDAQVARRQAEIPPGQKIRSFQIP